MLDYQLDYEVISACIDLSKTEQDIFDCCRMMDTFWSQHCEVTKTYFIIFTYTKTNSSAKRLWNLLKKKVHRQIHKEDIYNGKIEKRYYRAD